MAQQLSPETLATLKASAFIHPRSRLKFMRIRWFNKPLMNDKIIATTNPIQEQQVQLRKPNMPVMLDEYLRYVWDIIIIATTFWPYI